MSGTSSRARVFLRRARQVGGLLAAVALLACAESERQSGTTAVALEQFPVLRDMVYHPGGDGDGLLVDRFEVTDGEYARFMQETGYGRDRPEGFLSHWVWPEHGVPTPPQRNTPVVRVSLTDAHEYARARGKDLPTRQEWQSLVPGFEEGFFPWSEESYSENCNVLATGLGRATEVGVFEAGLSESGCYDLIGNVWEWALGDDSPAYVMGGSFTTRVRDEDGVGSVGRRPLEQSRVLARHPDERSFDVGFRCVIRDADRLLEECLDRVEGLEGLAREQAIQELLRVGQPSRGKNRVLPFVAEREFRTRLLWSVPGPEAGALLRSPVPLREDGDREDLLVVSRGLLQGRSGEDGRLLLEVPLPSTLSIPEVGVLGPRAGRAWFWTENEDGGIRLVDLPDGMTWDLPPPPEEQISEAIEVHQVGGEGLLFVQSLYQESGTWSEHPDRDLVRLQMLRSDASRELRLPGVFEAVHLVPGNRALISTSRALDLAAALPFGRDGRGQQPEGLGDLANLQVHALYLVHLDELRVLASRQLVADPVEGRRVLGPLEFLAPAPPARDSVLVALGQLTASLGGHLADGRAYELLLLDLSTLETRRRIRWETGHQGRLHAADAPLTYLGLTEGLQPEAIGVIDGEVQRFALDVPSPLELSAAGADREWWRPGRAGRAGPLLFTRTPDRFAVHRLGWRGARPQLETIYPGLVLTSEISRYLWGGAGDPRLALVLQSGEVKGLDLRRAGVPWTRMLPERSGEVQVMALDRGGEDLVLVGPPPASLVWWWDWSSGEERGEFQVRRAPIGKFALVDVAGGPDREWVVSLTDPAIVAPGLSAEDSSTHMVVSLGAPDPAATRLLSDFEEEARRGNR